MNDPYSLDSLVVIGDVHGKINKYWEILQKIGSNQKTIQVGDFGFKKEHLWHLNNVDSATHQINFGNHDDYTFLNESHSLSDWSYQPKAKLMTVRGACSIDKSYRIENLDWWSNEELSYKEMQNVIDFYNFNKPKVMITHDCPDYIRRYLFGIKDKSITSNGLQEMLENHQPELWVFGHHHKSIDKVINGTRFVCLNELEYLYI